MAKMSLNELKMVIAEMLDEAKKKSSVADAKRRRTPAMEAYGLYDEAFDFSEPLGPFNLYRQQGVANWGPYTAENPHIDSTFRSYNPGATQMHEQDEHALRLLVREVLHNGLVPPDSAWAPLVERQRVEGSTNIWERADRLLEAWYDNLKKSSKRSSKKSGKGYEKTSYGDVKKYGQPPKKK